MVVIQGVVSWDGGYPGGEYQIGSDYSNEMMDEFDGCEVRVTIEVVRSREQVEKESYGGSS